MVVTFQGLILAFVSLFPQAADRAQNLPCWRKFTGQIGKICRIKGQ